MARDGAQRRFHLGSHGQPLVRVISEELIDHRGMQDLDARRVDTHWVVLSLFLGAAGSDGPTFPAVRFNTAAGNSTRNVT